MLIDFTPDAQKKLREVGFDVTASGRRMVNNHFRVEPPVTIQGQVAFDTAVSIGSFVGCFGARIANVNIGRYCSISANVQTGWSDHPADWVSTSMMGYVPNVHQWGAKTGRGDVTPPLSYKALRGMTTIGNDVWIGEGAHIRAGVTIGTGAIIGARALVLGDVPPYAIVAGTPARLIRYRFPDLIINGLLKTEWWKYHLYDLPMHLLSEPEAFIESVLENQSIGRLIKFEPKWIGPKEIGEIVNA